MAKEVLKKLVRTKQSGKCALTKTALPEESALFDTDRKVPKAKGGTYTRRNTTVVLPLAHMQHHGTLRIRTQPLDELKAVVDDRAQVMKLRNKVDNQIRAYKRRTDHLNADTLCWLEEQSESIGVTLVEKDNALVQEMKSYSANPLAKAALGVKGVGPITVAHCLVYIDLVKARYASSLWAYAGLDKPSHKRYEKGAAGGGNKNLRTQLYTMADSQVKCHGAYRPIYDQVKARLGASEKEVESRNTEGHLVIVKWKDAKPCHRHGAAIRAIMKHFLADYWFVGREILGLPTAALYAEAVLGNGHKTISPRERGWTW